MEDDVAIGVERPAAIHQRQSTRADDAFGHAIMSDQHDSPHMGHDVEAGVVCSATTHRHQTVLPENSATYLSLRIWPWLSAVYRGQWNFTEVQSRLVSACTGKFKRKPDLVWVPSILRLAFSGLPMKKTKYPGQAIFLCFDQGRRGQFAVQVPCFRPTAHRRPTRSIRKKGENGDSITTHHWNRIRPTERACESEDQIVKRMKDKLEDTFGMWVKFVPYFGVVSADIVEFRFLPDYVRQDHLPIAIKERENGTTIVEQLSRKYTKWIELSQEAASNDDGDGVCTRSPHSKRCLTSKDPLLPCIDDEPKWLRAEVCKDMEARFEDYHIEICEFPWGTCIEQERAIAALVGMPGIDAIRQLPRFLRRPLDATGWPLSKWMKRENLLSDVRGPKRIVVPPDAKAYDGRYSLLGIKLTLGWDFDSMKVDAPSHLALALIAGGVVWLSVILWARETNDSSTAMAFGSVLVGFFSLLLSNAQNPTK